MINRLPFLPTSLAVKNSHPNTTIIVVINKGIINVPTIVPRKALGVLVTYGGVTITTNTIPTICLQNTMPLQDTMFPVAGISAMLVASSSSCCFFIAVSFLSNTVTESFFLHDPKAQLKTKRNGNIIMAPSN